MRTEDYIQFFTKGFNSDLKTFLITSCLILIIAYSIRLFYRKSSFEYIKIMLAIIIFTISLNFTYKFWKDNEQFKMETRIISVQTSSLTKKEKAIYINKAKNNIKLLHSGILSEKKEIENTFYGIGSLLLWMILIILIRDLISFRKIFNLKTEDKALHGL